MDEEHYIVFDIGGTNMRVAAATKEALGEIKKVPTPKDFEEGVTTFLTLAKEEAKGVMIVGAAGCVAADTIDENGVMGGARNLPKWQGFNIVHAFSDGLGVQVKIVNDTALVGLGELFVGAGKGATALVYVTVSTGVGAAYIVGGVVKGAGGTSWVKIAGVDLESQISGTAVKKKFGIEPKDLESLEERNKLADTLAEGLEKILEKWPADTIVLGGSMIVGVNPVPIEQVRASLGALLKERYVPNILMATLGDNGGLEGARMLASHAANK